MSEKPLNKFLQQLTNCIDIDNLIIKGHILTEHALNFYIEINSFEKPDKNSKFTYATKIEIAQLLGLFKTNKELKKDLKLLNKLRNSIAHNLNYNEEIFDELLSNIHRLGNDSLKDMKNDAQVFIKNNEPQIFEKINDKFVPLFNGTTKISGRHIKFMGLIARTCGFIFSLAEDHSKQKKV